MDLHKGSQSMPRATSCIKSEPGLDEVRSYDSNRSEYHEQEGRFTQEPGVSITTRSTCSPLGDSGLIDSAAVLMVCRQHGTVLLSTIPGKGTWFPVVPVKENHSFGETVEDFLQLYHSKAVFSEPLLIDHLRLLVPRLSVFIERVLFYVEITSEDDATACPMNRTSASIPGGQVIFFADALKLNNHWGPEPSFFLNLLATGQQPTRCNLTEMSLKRILACLRTSPECELLTNCGLTDGDVLQLYSDYSQHCWPSATLNLHSFAMYLLRSRIRPALETLDAITLFRCFRLTSIQALTFHELLYGLAALDWRCPHGAQVGRLRVNYIYRYYAGGPKPEDELDYDSLRCFARDLLATRQSNEPAASGVSPSLLTEQAILQECYSAFNNLQVPAPVSKEIFTSALSQLRIRGTSNLCRWEIPPPLALLKTVPPIYGPIQEAYQRTTKHMCPQCLQKPSYTLAANVIFLSANGKVKQSDSLQLVKDIKRRSPAARRQSDNLFDGTYFATELLHLISDYQNKPDSQWNSKATRLKVYLPKILQLCEEAKALLSAEARLLAVKSPAYVLGDIHGNISDLMIYEQNLWPNGPSALGQNYIFLGDYVDRGEHSVECAIYLLAFKLLAPKNVYLLRGNHEVRALNRDFTFPDECTRKFGKTEGAKLYEAFSQAFDCLPLGALIDGQIFAAHGGIPSTPAKLSTIGPSIPCPMVNPETESPPAWEILWNDPANSQADFVELVDVFRFQGRLPKFPKGFVYNARRGTGYYWSDEAVDAFLASNRITHVIRAHEVFIDGYRLFTGGRVISIFSCSRYCGLLNSAAVALLDGNTGKIRLIKVDTVVEEKTHEEKAKKKRKKPKSRPKAP